MIKDTNHAENPIGISVLSYHRRDKLERCLDALRSHPYFPMMDLFVVDNASDPAQRIWLADLHMQGILKGLILNNDNKGWVRAKNQGLVQLQNYEMQVLLEGDTILEGDGWPYHAQGLFQAGVKALMGRMQQPHKDALYLSKTRINDTPVVLCPDFLMKVAILHRSVVQRVGGLSMVFDAPWGAYADIDYGVRIIKNGFTACPFAVALDRSVLAIEEDDEDADYKAKSSDAKEEALKRHLPLYLERRREIMSDRRLTYEPLVSS